MIRGRLLPRVKRLLKEDNVGHVMFEILCQENLLLMELLGEAGHEGLKELICKIKKQEHTARQDGGETEQETYKRKSGRPEQRKKWVVKAAQQDGPVQRGIAEIAEDKPACGQTAHVDHANEERLSEELVAGSAARQSKKGKGKGKGKRRRADFATREAKAETQQPQTSQANEVGLPPGLNEQHEERTLRRCEETQHEEQDTTEVLPTQLEAEDGC